MKILLDENFPLALFRSLQADGEHVEHIITLGWRGASDQRIRERLLDSELLFLTQDEDFLFDKPVAAVIMLSRVRQSRRLKERVEIWRQGIRPGLQSGRPRGYDVLRDNRILSVSPAFDDGPTGGVRVVINWFEELKRLVPRN